MKLMVGRIFSRCFQTPQDVTNNVAMPIPRPHPSAIWLPFRSSGSASVDELADAVLPRLDELVGEAWVLAGVLALMS